ncbi:MAG: cation-translocating P-type ATPase [Ardenticatenaceae bacterium]|nr:cation-translocating P-type ATPase [Ardenticatenaceae bacterium]MCB8972369.1 cation-translocating P-type ATPase [Ardenticatenaceae bacterium]
MAQKPWHTVTTEELVQTLNLNLETGLGEAEAAAKQAQFGPNELTESGGVSPVRLLVAQFTNTMVLILIAAAVVSGFLGKVTETAAIAAIVILFALLGFFQEYRAEQAMAALKRLAVPLVRVRRNGELRELSAKELVPGDVVLLEAGNAIPADLRLVECVNLRIQEAALTGESEPVEKHTEALPREDVPLGDRRNMAYMGTVVTYGRGTAVVTGTGMETELGKIATLLQTVESGLTPLQQRLDQVGKQLAIGGVIVAALVMVIGILRGESVEEMFLTAVSVAVAVVPEGLPAVVTVTLALGAQRMLRRRALIRKLPAVETLGSVTTICSDKTGTLTENRMTVTIIDVAGHFLELQGTAKHPAASLQLPDASPDFLANQPPEIGLALAAGALCNDASLRPDPQTGRFSALGDPTEGALLVAASQVHLRKSELETVVPRVAELPFDADRKRMTTVHRLPESLDKLPLALRALADAPTPFVSFTKGAVDGLLPLCPQIWLNGTAVPLDPAWVARIEAANEEMAQNGMRVLGLAMHWQPDAQPEEDNLIFIGLSGMIDPPRPEVKTAVATCKSAGIRPIMITGDHPLTARFIAHDLGITDNMRVKTGQDLSRMTPEELGEVVKEVSVYARVTPEHKLRIVEALQNQGQVVAMTGDGVNDSPALRKADIGIAMGITGTDVSKEASEMVLLDDNFATIVSSVEEGRAIYDNIRRFVKFSIAGNVGKVLVMLLAPFVGINVALLPLQLLWLNLLTDGLLGLGLGVEPAEPNSMEKPPRSPQESLFSGGLTRHVIWVGLVMGLVALGLGVLYHAPDDPANTRWQTMIFTALAFMQMGQALASRSTTASLASLGLRTNPVLLGLVLVTAVLQLIVIYTPALDQFFQVTPLSGLELLLCAGLGLGMLLLIELEKVWLRRQS